jgi:ACS family tartrate transporter-like MFS transporter
VNGGFDGLSLPPRHAMLVFRKKEHIGENVEQRLFAKVAWRIIPFLLLLFIVAFLDRVNVGLAALYMNKAIGISSAAYGFGAGIFFLGYFLFEIPSNVIMEKVGARIWIFRIIITWGLISMATALVQGEKSFYALRFTLGLAEAGFFPGMILYMSYWFPPAVRARFGAFFLIGIPLAQVIGAPISGWILAAGGFWGIANWQWLFILEGVPACILAFVTLFYLPNGPGDAKWLSKDEKRVIAEALSHEVRDQHSLWPALRDMRVLLLSLIYLGIVIGAYGVVFFMPLMVEGHGFSDVDTGYIVSGAYLVSAVAMIAIGWSSDRYNERIWHIAVPVLIAAAGLAGAAFFHADAWSILFLVVALSGIYGSLPSFWSMPSAFLGGTAAAAGIAMINAIGNLGGFFGPNIMGGLRGLTDSYAAGLLGLAVGLIVAAIAVFVLGRNLSRRERVRAFDKFAPPA